VNLRCYLLSLLRIHSPNCEVCNARKKYGVEMRQRLEELNWRTLPDSHANGDHGRVVEEFDSEPGELISTPVSLMAQQRTTIVQ
jgi:collagenase-like PrtC family protease